MIKNDACSSELLALKLQQLDSLIQIIRRTLDSSDASIYFDEVISLMGTAGDMTKSCEVLRRRMDVELYDKSSKYYELYSQIPDEVS